MCCELCGAKTKDAWQCSGCKKYVCQQCHETVAEQKLTGTLEQLEKGAEDDAEMHHEQLEASQ